ncbi:MAG: hypothetical protein A3G52_04945 [Candidatus Taylorbacteria bacterium RIFCSPLOWO2_12_FULL_43_20]|uniref:Copper resistance protein D domain-containing protein n=1 Tax=Candidatus Taylorbacteria bacterium RIFCSPLOWO2_12_FULL_43_20 TaxID=1802332 RepID=A0A1G2NZ47_9BACT|nr:MAG: hypothetical protein A2825_03415 [Candidatus Taylorbacteria bacterium RIFCSPHIGHO2_01_FULL_43_120]OHA23761.1 MAG: hypothetical protein A3B98_02940 [Candidatus Taylorbacteria bacterium RIFCSPHIGHO2_02_FULL_43_55]OHA30216.1 MAG: hypothetical protein A3E92_01335 [Candidatus Taylorbacteria bacterium RIFCSPHIGHO2_12_FULL_42_34]OHA31965.1 MAG: hypothetical protein A3B09_01095 [Candidatus Taylorbacteria bacterium RIFCSPLOWO2_01_FULL_43_83]OHA37988.1 MAG: hypothetical protein A3H58_01510 [Candi
MDLSILVKAFGIYLAVSGLFLLVKGKTLPLILKDFFDHPAIIYLAAMALVLFGSLIIVGTNTFETVEQGWLTVIGWIVLAKGLTYTFIPDAFSKLSVKKLRPWLIVWAIVAIILGVYMYVSF